MKSYIEGKTFEILSNWIHNSHFLSSDIFWNKKTPAKLLTCFITFSFVQNAFQKCRWEQPIIQSVFISEKPFHEMLYANYSYIVFLNFEFDHNIHESNFTGNMTI